MKIKKIWYLYLKIYLLLFIAYFIYWSFYIPIPEIEFGTRYKRKVSTFEQYVYLEKINIHFTPEDFRSVYFLADHYGNDWVVNESLILARKHYPDYQLLNFILYSRLNIPEGYNIIKSLDLNNYKNKKALIYSYCLYPKNDNIVIKEKMALIKTDIDKTCHENNYFLAPNFFIF